jgi:hypothetical protein
MFLQADDEPQGAVVARAPGERDEPPTIPRWEPIPPPPPPPPSPSFEQPPSADDVVCPRCGERNPQTRVRCQRCGLELRPRSVVAEPAPPPLPTMDAGPRRFRLWPIVALAVALVAALAAAGFVYYRGKDGTAPTGQPSASAPGRVPVDPGVIAASASSTGREGNRFVVSNTLDGNLATTWQSDGDRLSTNVGVSLTYRFNRPVRLAGITVVNGDARSDTDYQNNERVSRFAVRTDGGERSWELRDSVQPQTLDLDGTAVNSVTLVVQAVYKGTRFKDVAISEVSFVEQQ